MFDSFSGQYKNKKSINKLRTLLSICLLPPPYLLSFFFNIITVLAHHAFRLDIIASTRSFFIEARVPLPLGARSEGRALPYSLFLNLKLKRAPREKKKRTRARSLTLKVRASPVIKNNKEVFGISTY